MSTFFDTLAPDHIHSLPVYQPGKPVEELERELGIRGALKIASNENPLGPSPRALAAILEAAAQVHWYPDGAAFALRRALCERLGVSPGELLFGAGSNEIIYMIIAALCRPGVDEVLTHKYAFLSYRLASHTHNVAFRESEVTGELACDTDALIAAMTPRTKVVFLANPNNPTGSYVETLALERILEALPPQALLVVDEAYSEYATVAALRAGVAYPDSQSYRSPRMPRVLTLRTFSKIYGLAGMRVGYAIGDARVIDLINRVRRPFNVNSLAQAAAVAALDDSDHIDASRRVAQESITALSEAAERLGLAPYRSLGNFILVDVKRDAAAVYQDLLPKGVIVRPMGVWGLPRHLRISVARAEDTARVIEALTEVIGAPAGPR